MVVLLSTSLRYSRYQDAIKLQPDASSFHVRLRVLFPELAS